MTKNILFLFLICGNVKYVSSTKHWRYDFRCGGDYLASNGKSAICDPNGTKPCCSQLNWCGNTTDHCDCEGCIDYRVVHTYKAWRRDGRCGGSYRAPNGQIAQCDPDGPRPCCSRHNKCGNTDCNCEILCHDYRKISYEPPKPWTFLEYRCGTGFPAVNGQPAQCNPKYDRPCCAKDKWCSRECDCEGCIDYSATNPNDAWRPDLRCGDGFLAPNGQVAQCNPDGRYPCCSPHYRWCGNTRSFCECEGCIDYRAPPWRDDHRCGEGYLAPNGEVAQCNPDGTNPCCSPYNECGNSTDHCDCEGCIDYKAIQCLRRDCPPFFRLNETTCQCECARTRPCRKHFTLDKNTCKCECGRKYCHGSFAELNKRTCRCECKVFYLSCRWSQYFDRATCRCECKRRNCHGGYHFSEKTCRCECQSQSCQPGYWFNERSCRCETVALTVS